VISLSSGKRPLIPIQRESFSLKVEGGKREKEGRTKTNKEFSAIRRRQRDEITRFLREGDPVLTQQDLQKAT